MKNRTVILFLAVVLVAPGIAAAQYGKDTKKATDKPATEQSQIKQSDDAGRVSAAAAVVREFAAMPEGAPRGLVEKAAAVVVVPDLMKSNAGVDAQHGNGVLSVKNADGSWSEPVFVKLTGGDAALSGASPTDLVLVFMNDHNIAEILESDFTLGGDVSVAAGPIGSAGSDARFDATIYSYTRGEGAFAGVAVNGAQLSVDTDAIARVYGGQLKAFDVAQKQPEPGSPGEELANALKQLTGTLVAPEPTTGSTGAGK
jgi:lipid-binding SYLF domain-containing protein